jgi:hypothetical protein
LSNVVYDNINVTIYQEFQFNDSNTDFVRILDNTNEPYNGTWQLILTGYGTYSVVQVGSSLVIDYFTLHNLPSVQTTLPYELRDGDNNLLAAGTGLWFSSNRGVVDITGDYLKVIRNEYVQIITSSSHYYKNQYKIIGFIPNDTNRLYIENYTIGTIGNISINIIERLIDAAVGYFHYQGMTLLTNTNYEVSLGIQNGVNSAIILGGNAAVENSHFKENYLVLINGNYYAISEIDGMTITLNGPFMDCGLSHTANQVTFQILWFIKEIGQVTIPPRENDPIYIPGGTFASLNRDVTEVIMYTSNDNAPIGIGLLPNNEILNQKESISVKIERFKGEK